MLQRLEYPIDRDGVVAFRPSRELWRDVPEADFHKLFVSWRELRGADDSLSDAKREERAGVDPHETPIMICPAWPLFLGPDGTTPLEPQPARPPPSWDGYYWQRNLRCRVLKFE